MKRLAIIVAVGIGVFAPACIVRAQSQGPITPSNKNEVKKGTAQPETAAPPPMPVDDLIHRVALNEDRMKKAYDQYSFTQSVKVTEESNPGGEFFVTGEMYLKSDGERYERIVKQPVSTLKQTAFTLEDVKTIASMPLFFLTTGELTNYKYKYQGTEKMDELDTYVVRVQPKTFSRKEKFFDGVIWVDQRDFAIVKSSGRFVQEVEAEGSRLPFSMFDTYRENIAGQYWFPTYISSEDTITPPKSESIPMKLVVRSSNFQPNPIPVNAAPANGNNASGAPAKPN